MDNKDNEKDEKKSNIVLIHDVVKDGVTLTEEEAALKANLARIEEKVASVEKVRDAILKEDPSSVFATEMFDTLVGAIAISAASEVIAEFFGLPKDSIDTLF